MAATALALPQPSEAELDNSRLAQLQEVPCCLTAEIPVRGFTVRDLLLLKTAMVINSKQLTRDRIGLRANGSRIAWAEFEVVGGRLGVRFTDLE